jgi:hypothetical protein
MGGDRKGATMQRKLFLILVLAVAAFGLGAGSAGAESSRGVFVGRVAGSQAFVAVAIGHGKVRAYLCDTRRLAVWFPAGTFRAGRAELNTAGARLAVRLASGHVLGKATLADGRVHRFRAVRATGAAGLYRAVKTVHGRRYLAGWVVLRGGAQRGATEKFINPNVGLVVQPAPTLDPEHASVQLAGAGAASVVKLGDSFIEKTGGG